MTDHWKCGHERTPENTQRHGAIECCSQCWKARFNTIRAGTNWRNACLVEAYQEGATFTQLQSRFGIAYSTVYNILADAGALPTNVPKYRIAQVIDAASKASGIAIADIKGTSRRRRTCRVRQAAMYIAREAGNGFSAIGRAFGKDHSTVIHAWEKIPVFEQYEVGCAALLRAIRRILEGHKAEPIKAPVIAKSAVKRRNDFRAKAEERDSAHEFHLDMARGSAKLAAAIQGALA